MAARVRLVSTLITNIGELVTNSPPDGGGTGGGTSTGDGTSTGSSAGTPGTAGTGTGSGPGAFASLANAALVMEAGRVAWVGPASRAPVADDIVDARGRAVLPGFVDSHAHLVFAGERGAEFAARMAGAPYQAGGIASTVKATRQASDPELRAGLRRLVAEMLAQGTPTLECKSGYGLSVKDEERSLRLAA